jgi:ABC-type multidrug transport system fused ATPase/permease subunit
LDAVAQESFSNIRTVRSFANEDKEVERYALQVNKAYNLARKMGILIGGFQGLSTLGIYGSVLFVLLYGGTLVSAGELTSGALTSCILY